jgi:hypothetical protein
MITIPFSPATFASDAKPKISGVNVSLDFANIESPLIKVAVDMKNLIGVDLYNKLIAEYSTPIPSDTTYSTALDYLQRAMLHFAMYEHLIFLIVRIGNDGVTVKKNDDETTIFKYQQDELSNKLIATAWFWADQLLEFIETNQSSISEWANSTTRTEYNALPVSAADFTKWVGIDDAYFIYKAKWLINEVWNDRIAPRKLDATLLESLHGEISRAVIYSVLHLACLRMAYAELPETIRKDISSELLKKNSDYSENYIREKISQQFAEKAVSYWNAVDMAIKSTSIAANSATVDSQPTFQRPPIYREDSFYFGG